MKPLQHSLTRSAWIAMTAALCGSVQATPEAFVEDGPSVAEFIRMDVDADQRMAGTKVDVELRDGIAVLSGSTHSLAQAERAVARAVATRGVRGVVNRLEIRPAPEGLEQRVREALLGQKLFSAAQIQVSADGGRVSLDGTVGVWDERELAREVVSSVPGVTVIGNKLIVTDEGTRGDEQIASQLRFQMADDPLCEGLDLAVSVSEGAVVLNGEVGSRGEFDRLVRRSYVTGVIDVRVSDISINPDLAMEGLEEKNYDPQQAVAVVREVLAMDDRLQGAEISAAAETGAVRLDGRVRDIAQSDLAESAARAVPGVLRVMNNLKMQAPELATRENLKLAAPPLIRPNR